ncbi:MAG TPA: RNA polymerase sigma factor [Polyangiaceae bacterium]
MPTIFSPEHQRNPADPDTHSGAKLVSLPEAGRNEATSAAEPRECFDFDAIYSEHFPFVWRCLRSLGVSPAALDDAAQEVFVVVHRRLAEFRAESTLRTWLYGIVRNVAQNQRRSLGRRGIASPLDENMSSPSQGPDESAADAEAAEFVAAFVDSLDAKKRDIFVLALLEELTIPEVASALDVPLNTAYTRLRAVRAEFRRALERRGKS